MLHFPLTVNNRIGLDVQTITSFSTTLRIEDNAIPNSSSEIQTQILSKYITTWFYQENVVVFSLRINEYQI